jgi:hypothetical protein
VTPPNLDMTARMPTARSTDAAAARRKPDCEAVRLNYFLERKLVAALQQDRHRVRRELCDDAALAFVRTYMDVTSNADLRRGMNMRRFS